MREVPGESQYVVTCDLAIVRCGPDHKSPDFRDEYLYRDALVPPNPDQRQIASMLAADQIKRIEWG